MNDTKEMKQLLLSKGYRFVISFESYTDALNFVPMSQDNEIIMVKDEFFNTDVFEVWYKD